MSDITKYQELDTIPAYAAIERDAEGNITNKGAILWGGKDAPPAIGSTIYIAINRCGPAVVTGYFIEGGFLGVRCRLTNPPEWHVKQNKGDPNGHVFGPEFVAMDRQFWAARGKKQVGPFPTREHAASAFRAAYPVPASKAGSRSTAIMTGYGNFGPSFDIQWVSAKAEG